MSRNLIADYLRTHKQVLADEWEMRVRADVDELAALDRSALLDHFPEVLDGLAAWLAGDSELADRAFNALADGHALQRLGFGIELKTLNREYAHLRRVILEHMLRLREAREWPESIVALNAGLDRAILRCIERYSGQRDQFRERFIGILGHDLRNPLSAIANAAQLLLESERGESREHRAATIIDRAAHRMGQMIAELLDFAQGHVGDGIPARPVADDMAQICAAVVDELRSANPKRTIQLAVSGDLVGTFDRARVMQALGNLLANALHHGTEPIVLRAWETDDRHAVVTRVSNAGRPIPAESIATLFDPFRRGHSGGIGLGLFIVKEIARSHGGLCDVASTPSETAFTIRWPRAPREETPTRP